MVKQMCCMFWWRWRCQEIPTTSSSLPHLVLTNRSALIMLTFTNTASSKNTNSIINTNAIRLVSNKLKCTRWLSLIKWKSLIKHADCALLMLNRGNYCGTHTKLWITCNWAPKQTKERCYSRCSHFLLLCFEHCSQSETLVKMCVDEIKN